MNPLLAQVTIVLAAGAGATFEALYRASVAVTDRTYERREDFSYYLRIVEGLLAGVLLALVLPEGSNLGITPIGVAILGGFGAPAVYRILSRLVEALEGIVGGNERQIVDTVRAEERVQQDLQRSQLLVPLAEAMEEARKSNNSRLQEVLERLWMDFTGRPYGN